MTLPNPIPIIIPALEDTQQTFQISLGELEAILRDPRIADKKVCVVSVAGAFRTGKSFILNFFLRYLQWKTSEGNNETDLDWLTTKIQLNGFSWRGGDDRDTNGILIWPEAFILDDRNGEEIVTILMDTQGIFDCTSTVKSCATIFALSTMISSVQVYNIHNTIQEDHLQHLHLFTEYARLAMDEYNDAKPFQTLMFLVRDWSYPYVAEYGLDGGQRILEKRLLEVAPNQHKELQQLRQHIKSSFDNIQCFLMPHPGLDVTTNPNFRGELVSISADFKTQLRVLIPHLFDPDNLVVKTVNGQHVTFRELAVYINAYFDVFNGAELPEPKTILNATAEANNLAAVARSKAMYMKEMEKICDTPFMTSAQLREHHNRCQANAVQLFDTAKKMGGQKLAENFRGRLLEGIQEAFEFFVRTNNANSSNLFLPMVMSLCTYLFAALLVIQYIFHELFQQLGLNMMTLMLAIVIVLLFAWHSGHLKGAQKTLMDCLLKPSVVKKDM